MTLGAVRHSYQHLKLCAGVVVAEATAAASAGHSQIPPMWWAVGDFFWVPPRA